MRLKHGSTFEITSTDNVTMVKWIDNKLVCLASSFIGSGSLDTVQRWDKKQKEFMIDRPECVKRYNYAMGRVDQFNQMISYYRIFIKSKKWTLRAIFYAIDFAVVQSWIEYKRDALAQNIPKKKTYGSNALQNETC